MGVCKGDGHVMHWQSSRYHEPAREHSPALAASLTLGSNAGGQCRPSAGHLLMRQCASCPDSCEHPSKIFPLIGSGYNDSCRRSPDRMVFDENAPPQTLIHPLHNPHHLHHHNHNNNNNNNSSNNNNNHPLPPNVTDNNFLELTSNSNKSDCLERTSLNNVNNLSGSSSNNNNDSNIEYNLQLKSEPIGGPSSPESLTELSSSPDDCAGCGQLIQDRFYLSAVEKRWHAGCLQCCMCRQLLEGETSCYSREENIYCKTDYYRLYGNRRCARCLATISSSELVMRARHLVFHVRCFSCAICNTLLTKGDQYGMRDSTIYCRLHYDITMETESIANQAKSLTMSCQQPQPFGTSPIGPPSPSDTKNFFGGSQHSLPGLTQPPRQKGRPRKRKPKDLDAMTANLDLSTEYLDLSYGRGHGMSASSRTKRMRTSFKHHQLRTMKSYFTVNHNPDAKDLKQLSQKTGLPKRVLQVWFQNARAKWRRMMMKQEGKSGGGGPESEKGDMSLDLDSYSDHSPSFMMGGPHSPHSMD